MSTLTQTLKVCLAEAALLEPAEPLKTAFPKVIAPLLAEFERLERDLAAARAEADIKGEFLSSRQCADHSGKWERGRCLQCELEAARKDAERTAVELAAYRRALEKIIDDEDCDSVQVAHQTITPFTPWKPVSPETEPSIDAAMRQEKAGQLSRESGGKVKP